MNIGENIIEFEDYAEKTNYSCSDLSQHKYYHSIRVVSYALLIAQSLNLNEKDIYIASITALLHDIGRFKEYEKTNEIQDHGDESYRVLKENDYIYTYTTDGDIANIVLAACKYHNKYELPQFLDERTKLFCNIVRDADKLDIILEQNKIIDDGNIDVHNFESVRKHKMCKNEYCHSKAEHLVRQLAFIFDLKFPISFQILKDKNIISESINNLKNHTNQSEINEIETILNNYIEENLKC